MRAVVPAAFALLLSNCGYVGDPLPPLLRIPSPVSDLSAVQRGDRIIVQFTVPRFSTEGALLREAPQLDLRAGPAPAPFDAQAWTARARAIGPGPVEGGRARYEVPVSGWAGSEIVVGVRAVGEGGREAGWSNFAVVGVVEPLAQPEELRAESVPGGVRLAWRGRAELFRVFRRAAGEQAFGRAGETGEAAWTDAAAEPGRAYEYLVRGIARTGAGEAESEPSAAVRITPEDRLAPTVPAGLTGVASMNGIELAWERNTEADFSAYRVWRAAQPDGQLAPVAESGQTPGYTDRAVERGRKYRYAVSALDTAGNDSAPSEAVEVTAP